MHDALRLVGLAVEDGSSVAKILDQKAVFVIVHASRQISVARIMPGEHHVLFDADGNAVQRADWLAFFLQVLV